MADSFIASEVLVLEANMGTTVTPIWKKIVCLSEKSFNGTTSATDIVTDCNEGFTNPQPSKKSWTISFSGYAATDPAVGEGSFETTYQLWDNRTITEFRIRNAGNTYYRAGRGWLSDVSEPSSAGDYLQFSGTITGNGPVATTGS
jgi:hypothetical protein